MRTRTGTGRSFICLALGIATAGRKGINCFIDKSILNQFEITWEDSISSPFPVSVSLVSKKNLEWIWQSHYLCIDKKTIFAKDEIDRQSYQEHSFLVQTVQGKQAFRFRVCID